MEYHPIANLQRLADATAGLLTALHQRDAYTHAHSNRVRELAEETARRCGLSRGQRALLRLCARFHDVGKIGIPDSILFKPGKLTDAELEVMRTHAALGAAIVGSVAAPNADDCAHVIRHHHEHFDGQGYPDGLRNSDIPICARIIAVVDCYDAMTSQRAYSHRRSPATALEVIRDGLGTQFDPHVAETFVALMI
jgi:HD-GYP domain-containing protein (c-di-GMP phosphodiesterase class II)